jgi:anhydro-N-acetylmuramic acid kinase
LAKTLDQISRKKTKLVVGLMSGTSADGIDAVVLRISGSGAKTQIRQLAFSTYPYPRGFKGFLLKNSSASTARLDELTRLNLLIADLFADAALKIVRKARKKPGDIDIIGSHGQTVHHLPALQRLFGKNVRGTLQLGNPSFMAKRTGIMTVGDFRTGDIAKGGTGAPLVPYFDYLMFRSRSVSRAVLNIGGIANITILPKSGSLKNVSASDTGPGNMLIDALMLKYYGRQADNGGTVASTGKIIPGLLSKLMQDGYLKIPPPKSTGRERYGQQFVGEIIRSARGARPADIIATVTEYTALTIYWHYKKYCKTNIGELFVGGGGIHNEYLMDALRRYFSGVKILPASISNISPDAKEAACFAVLANETVSGNPANVPGATGADEPTTLGTISLP